MGSVHRNSHNGTWTRKHKCNRYSTEFLFAYLLAQDGVDPYTKEKTLLTTTGVGEKITQAFPDSSHCKYSPSGEGGTIPLRKVTQRISPPHRSSSSPRSVGTGMVPFLPNVKTTRSSSPQVLGMTPGVKVKSAQMFGWSSTP